MIDAPTNWNKIKHFKKEEFEYPDHIKTVLLEKLDKLRDYVDHPIIITSDYRPAGDSGQHPLGKAVDCKCPEISLMDFYLAAERFNFPGIGVYTAWQGLHLDVRTPNIEKLYAHPPGARWGSHDFEKHNYLPLNDLFFRRLLQIEDRKTRMAVETAEKSLLAISKGGQPVKFKYKTSVGGYDLNCTPSDPVCSLCDKKTKCWNMWKGRPELFFDEEVVKQDSVFFQSFFDNIIIATDEPHRVLVFQDNEFFGLFDVKMLPAKIYVRSIGGYNAELIPKEKRMGLGEMAGWTREPLITKKENLKNEED